MKCSNWENRIECECECDDNGNDDDAFWWC